MRCGCPECGTYMVHESSIALGCICPACGYICRACLGTNSVISKDELRAIKEHEKEELEKEKQ